MKKLSCLLFGFLFLCVTNVSFAAGFDCRKATSSVENMICNDEELNSLDDSNTNLYYEVKKLRPGIAVDQKDWLKNIRNKCADKLCLVKTYSERNKQLESQLNVGAKPNAPVVDSKEKIVAQVQELTKTIQGNVENNAPNENIETQNSTQESISNDIPVLENIQTEAESTPTQQVENGTSSIEPTTEKNADVNQNAGNTFLNTNAKLFGGLLTLIVVAVGLFGFGSVLGMIIAIPVLIALAIPSKKNKKDDSVHPDSSNEKLMSEKSDT